MRQLKPFSKGEMKFLTQLKEPDASVFIAVLDDDPSAVCLQYEPGDGMRYNGGMVQLRVMKDELLLTVNPSTSLSDLAATPVHLIKHWRDTAY